MTTIPQLSVFLENKVGQLAQACKTLAEARVSLEALSIAATADFGIARFITRESEKAVDALRKAKFIVKTTPVVAVTVPDRAGGLAEVITQLSEKGCDIEYSYALASRPEDKAVLILKFADMVQAEAVLKETGLEQITLA